MAALEKVGYSSKQKMLSVDNPIGSLCVGVSELKPINQHHKYSNKLKNNNEQIHFQFAFNSDLFYKIKKFKLLKKTFILANCKLSTNRLNRLPPPTSAADVTLQKVQQTHCASSVSSTSRSSKVA